MNIPMSSKYQIVIPKEIRKALKIKKGEKFQIFVRGKVITLVPDRPLGELRGFIEGMNTQGIRDKEERL
jgi:AbrB family looped-hinge helix DNA binding protein